MTEKTVKYSCTDCGKKFDQKSHYDSHKKRKIPCVIKDQSLNEFIETKVKEEVDKKMKNKELSDSENNTSESNNMETENSTQSKKSVKSEKQKDKKKKEDKKSVKKEKPKQSKKKDIIVDESYLRNPINENVFKLVDEKNKNEEKQYVLSKIKQAHQILYEAENIEGENAMNDIMNLIFLRLIQDKLSNKNKDGKIDLFDKKYYSDYDENELNDIFKYFNLEELSNAPLNDLRSKENNDIVRQMGYVLKKHPITSKIFLEENFLRTEKSVTLQHLIKTMFIDKKTKWNVKKMYEIEDLIGEIFESFINGYTKTNSKLSQFFTPRHLMNLILAFFKNDLIKHIKQTDDYHVADFCMGTAGWLVIFYNLFKEKYSDKIKLSGGEVKPNTFQYALMNIITTTNSMPYYIQRENSLTHLDKNKYHLIVTNPPFKTSFSFDNVKKNFKDDSYTKQNKVKLEDVYELRDNNPPIQFLELCIYKLHDEGKCIIVLPYGELFFGSSYKKSRQHFLDTIDITYIILVPSGVFTHTGIKTCIMVFNKTDKGTKEITFLKTNKECTEITKITSIKREDINKEPNLSFYHRDYLNDEYIRELTEKMPDFEWIEFGKVFTLEKGKLQSSKVNEDENGDGYMITQSQNKDDYKKIIEYEYDGQCLFVGNIDSGRKFPVLYFEGKCSCTNLLSYCKINKNYENKINIKFTYYYLMSVKDHLTKTYLKGACNLSLDNNNFNRMKIPIPSIEVQKEIVEDMNRTEQRKDHYKLVIEANEECKMIYLKRAIKNCNKNKFNPEIKKLGDVCEMKNGKTITKEKLEDGKYPVIGGGKEPFGYHNVYNMNKNTILCATSGNAGYISKYDIEVWASDCFGIIALNEHELLQHYLYYYLLLIQPSIYKYKKGAAQDHIDSKTLSKFKIVIPNLERQKEIVKQCQIYDDFTNNMKTKLQQVYETNKTEFLEYLQNSI